MAGGGGEGELNLVPYMDIMVNLIMFMIIVTAYIVELREIPVLAPSYGSGGGSGEKPKAFLTVAISSTALNILASSDEVPSTELLREGDRYPYAKLSAALRDYRTNYDVTETFVLTADRSVRFGVVVAALDAARSDAKGPLFPGVTFALAVGK